jgi:hypothetical protein
MLHVTCLTLRKLDTHRFLGNARIEKITIISLNHSKILLFYSQYSTHYKIVKFC